MAMAPIMQPFVWGSGGRRLTPEELAREREIVDALSAQEGDTSPVGHWTQGAARVVGAVANNFRENRLNKQTERNAAEDLGLRSKVASLLSGGSTPSAGSWDGMAPVEPTTANVASALVPPGGGTPAQTAMVEGQPPIPGLQRAPSGMEAYRDAIASIESTGSGDYAAVGPTHPKMGRALGRYQIMESNIPAWSQEVLGRAVTAEEFMANPQLQDAIFDGKFGEYVNKFGPEGAAQAWFGGPGGVGKTDRKDVLGTSIGEYGQKFSKAIGGAATAYVDPMVSAQPAMPVSAQPSPAASGGIMDATASPMSEGYFPPAPSAPQAGGINPVIAEILMSDIASPQTMQMAELLMGREQQAQERALQEQQRAQEIQQRQAIAQQYGIDPTLVPVDEAWKLGLERSLKGGEPMPLMNLGDGTVYDPNRPEDQRFIRDPNRQQSVPDSIRALDMRAERAGLAPGTPEYNQFMLTEGKASGMQLRVGPDGTVEFAESGGLKPLTEAQGKDNVFMTRAQNAMPLIDTFEQNLLDFGQSAAGVLPGGMGNYLQSEEYQLARDAGREFLATILRKDTGAAVTESEEKMYGDMFLPRPGDKPKTVDAKRQRRRLAVEAIGTGMSIGQLERVAKAIEAVEPSTSVVDQAEQPIPDGIDPEDWKFMTPEERRLFQ